MRKHKEENTKMKIARENVLSLPHAKVLIMLAPFLVYISEIQSGKPVQKYPKIYSCF